MDSQEYTVDMGFDEDGFKIPPKYMKYGQSTGFTGAQWDYFVRSRKRGKSMKWTLAQLQVSKPTLYNYIKKYPDVEKEWRELQDGLVLEIENDLLSGKHFENIPFYIDKNGNKRYDSAAVNIVALKIKSSQWILNNLMKSRYSQVVSDGEVVNRPLNVIVLPNKESVADIENGSVVVNDAIDTISLPSKDGI